MLTEQELYDYYHQYRTVERGRGIVGVCNAGRYKVAISPYGDVKPCGVYRDSASVGNLKDTSFEDIWLRSERMLHYREQNRTYPISECVKCPTVWFCDLCPGLSHWAGEPQKPYKVMCQHAKVKHRIWTERLERHRMEMLSCEE
jgi:radical SAM protein with 4Fe4S-binding SPASM domain